jgi:hypothetical protein
MPSRKACVAIRQVDQREFAAYGRRQALEHPTHGPDTQTLQVLACNGQALLRLQLLAL